MERLDKIVVCETDRGNYAVRPLNWAGCWDKDGKIKESGLNHIAVFHYKEDAEWYAETKNAEEQGLLLSMPCKVDDTVYLIFEKRIYEGTVVKIVSVRTPSHDYTRIEIVFEIEDPRYSDGRKMKHGANEILGEKVFLTKEEAEQALKDMKGDSNEQTANVWHLEQA